MAKVTAGAISAMFETINGGRKPSDEQFEAFLKASDYTSPDFWPAAEIVLGAMPGAKRYDAAMKINALTPRDVFPDIRALVFAMDSVDFLPKARRKEAAAAVAYRAPEGSEIETRANLYMQGQRQRRNGNEGMSLRDFVASWAGTRPAFA